jgi:hypothetical protein
MSCPKCYVGMCKLHPLQDSGNGIKQMGPSDKAGTMKKIYEDLVLKKLNEARMQGVRATLLNTTTLSSSSTNSTSSSFNPSKEVRGKAVDADKLLGLKPIESDSDSSTSSRSYDRHRKHRRKHHRRSRSRSRSKCRSRSSSRSDRSESSDEDDKRHKRSRHKHHKRLKDDKHRKHRHRHHASSDREAGEDQPKDVREEQKPVQIEQSQAKETEVVDQTLVVPPSLPADQVEIPLHDT